MSTMDPEMTRRIDAVLARVKEPESNQSVGELGIIEKIRYVAQRRKMLVVRKGYANPKACCFLISKALEVETLDRVRRELEREFPDLTVELV
jgi:metal-sulfur cluster biosynthetic enzyme